MSKLGAKTLVDQVDELRQLEDSLGELKKREQVLDKPRHAIEVERDALLGALATAVPRTGRRRRPHRRGAVAHRLAEDAGAARAAAAADRARARAAAEEENRIPSAGSAGDGRRRRRAASPTRSASGASARRWCCRASQFTPMELIEQGDAKIAKIIADAQRGQPGARERVPDS